MIENILEYVATDALIQLWMTADAPEDEMERIKSQFRPELIAQFEDENDIPDGIIMREPIFHTNNAGEFHMGSKEPTVFIKEMTVVWGERNEPVVEDDDRWSLNRKVGPARLIMTGLQKWHDSGLIHRRRGDAIMCKQITYTWAKDGKFLRATGPYHISIREFTASGNRGTVSNIKLTSLVPSWSTMNSRKLPQGLVRDIIKNHGLKVNLLEFDNVFLSAEDEMIFLTELPDESK